VSAPRIYGGVRSKEKQVFRQRFSKESVDIRGGISAAC
jgi:hypothetical protein